MQMEKPKGDTFFVTVSLQKREISNRKKWPLELKNTFFCIYQDVWLFSMSIKFSLKELTLKEKCILVETKTPIWLDAFF